MWFRKSYHSHTQFKGSKKSLHSFIDKEFQLKYTLIFVGAAAVCMLMIAIPSYYYIQQNYSIFENLAFDTAPGIVDHLRHEKKMITFLFISVFFGFLLLFSILGLKITSRIVGPLKVLKNHIKFLSRGKWFQKPIKVRDNDEFLDIISAYNYFFESARFQIQKDLELLESLSINEEDKKNHYIWRQLIEQKLEQLYPPNDPQLKIDKHPPMIQNGTPTKPHSLAS